MVDPRFHPWLLQLVRDTIRHGAGNRDRADPPPQRFPAALRDTRCGSFVTLSRTRGQALRGCCGSTTPDDTLLVDLVENAWQTAFGDPRFPPVRPDELPGLSVEVSLLSPLTELSVAGEAELIAALESNRRGLLIDDGLRSATFLPKVWHALPDPGDFLMHLKHKAGVSAGEWPTGLRTYVYTTETFGGTVEPAPAAVADGGRQIPARVLSGSRS